MEYENLFILWVCSVSVMARDNIPTLESDADLALLEVGDIVEVGVSKTDLAVVDRVRDGLVSYVFPIHYDGGILIGAGHINLGESELGGLVREGRIYRSGCSFLHPNSPTLNSPERYDEARSLLEKAGLW